ncbi:hypothetical protein M433DRAFT_160289, partial [Acidomyces richmondensis BFW]
LDPSEVGMSAVYKQLYSGKEDKHGRFQWQNTIPEHLGKLAEGAEGESWAIIVRNVKAHNDRNKILSIHSSHPNPAARSSPKLRSRWIPSLDHC